MNKNLYKIISFCLVIIWMIVIFMLSEMNGIESTNKSKSVISKIITVFNHKIENTNSNNVSSVNDVNSEIIAQQNEEQIVNNANVSFRKFMHSSVYFVLALLVCNFINTFNIERKYIKYYLTLIFVFLYACTDEYHQLFVKRKNC